MNRLLLSSALIFTVAGLYAASACAQFTQPSPEELSMTSIPEVPGAPAVILYAEQTAEDNLHMWSYYYRVKVLTEGGKDKANVELPYISNQLGVSIDSIVGRTIHADGTVIPFTGKPYDKLIEKGRDYKVNSKVFTLPQVEVGSILEYRYKFRFADEYVVPPDWYIQSDLFLRKGHYSWKPTGADVSNDDEGAVHPAWFPLLPVGSEIKQRALQTSSSGGYSQSRVILELDVANVPPILKEDDMPPVDSLSERVLFYYTSAKTPTEYWARAGKRWAKAREKFIGSSGVVKAKAESLVSPADTQEVKLKKLYDFVQLQENTDFTRDRSAQENKAEGLKDAASAEDVLERKRGSSGQLTELFVALARGAGLKANVMYVSNRNRHVYLPGYLSFQQLDDYIAVVSVDGKDFYLDPGERMCTFKELAWKHTLSSGLRQDGASAQIERTPGSDFMRNHTSRIADLDIDDHGSADGTVKIEYQGAPALSWRQTALRGDDTSLNLELRTSLENRLPGGMEVRVTDVKNLGDPDKPLIVTYSVKGAIGTGTGRRLLLPYSLFESQSKPQFTATKRELPIDMEYNRYLQDAVRYKLPAGLVVESLPTPGHELLSKSAEYTTNSKQNGNSITLFRNLTLGRVYYGMSEYPDLRSFYGKLDAKQAEVLVLSRAAATGQTAEKPGN